MYKRQTLYGKDYFLTPDDALDAVLVTMGVLRKLWERDGVLSLIHIFHNLLGRALEFELRERGEGSALQARRLLAVIEIGLPHLL